MERGVGRDAGGIAGLARLLAEHGEAVEYELLCRGLRLRDLGTKRLTWRDLKVLVQYLPPANAIERARTGTDALWQLEHQLLAAVVDALNGANWQRAGDSRAQRPEPVPRPGVTADRGDRVDHGHAVTIDQAKALLGW